jgi:hypothetical protein
VTAPVFAESLCHRCAHLRQVRSARGSTFLLCEAAGLPKYPPQPVTRCAGFTPGADRGAG